MTGSSITALDHASVIVSDTAEALRFYRDLLGLELDASRPDLGYPGAWLCVGQSQIHLLQVPNPDPVNGRPEHGGRDRHIALAVQGLDEILERLQAAGVAFTSSRSGRKAAFCRDADGNGVELIERPA